jgi:hypothetical protein
MAALPKTPLRVEVGGGFLIDNNRKRGGGNASVDKVNKVGIEPYSCKSFTNERPFKTVKSFS